MDDLEEPIRAFIEESRENLDRVDREIVALEQSPSDLNLVSSIFRTLHTMKASCGFFDYQKLQNLTHVGENLLGMIRDRKKSFTSQVGTLLLRMADRIRKCVDHIDQTRREDDEDDSELVSLIEHEINRKEEPKLLNLLAKKIEAMTGTSTSPIDTSVRINLEVLDRLMDLVGELVLVRNQIVQRVEQHDDPQLLRAAKQLNHLTGKLQENILQTRMQPVQTLWNRMPRLVRDVAQMCTKEVTLKMTGGETEIDRSVMDAIKDPLTHLLRNAVDHGIEAPEKRSQLGKSRSGTIHLHSQYSNGQVVISIRDDGGGIAPQKVLKRAIEKGMISSLDAGRMSKDEIIQLIFLPGFSTAEKVSEVSGRGVGMDVVRSNIESIGGVIEIKSVENEGSEIRLKIPLTLAIVQGLIVGVHDQRMIVPQSSLVEIVHLDELECLERVTQIENGSVLQYRGNLIPMVRIESVLELELDPSESVTELTVLILQFESSLIGLIVPRIFDTEEIVIKGLSSDLTSLKIYSGATILGDGSIALVLDVHQLLSPYVFGGCSRGVVDPTPSDSNRHSAEGAVMLVESAGRRFAIQIREIKRMELVQHNSIQKTTRGEMIPHRGAILPVYRLGQNQDSTGNTAHDQSASLLVVEANAKEQGVLVERVVDICPADRIEYEDTETSMGLVDGIVTEFISIFDWLSVTAPSPNDYSSMEG